jgi:hypothetical protein
LNSSKKAINGSIQNKKSPVADLDEGLRKILTGVLKTKDVSMWIHLAQDWVQWPDLWNIAINLQFHKRQGVSRTGEKLSAS